MTDITSLLRAIAGGEPDTSNVRSVVAGLRTYGVSAGLDRPERFAHYVAQLAHESGRFRYDHEIWGPTPAQLRYEDRADLGHSAAVPGEAFKFRGRAGIQLTGRRNYCGFRDWCQEYVDPSAPDFEATPDAVNTDPWEGLAPIWYWEAGNPTGRSLNVYADTNNIEAVTRKVNGGLNGFDDRLALYVRGALVLLGYTLAAGVVRQFQRDAGFTGRDVDDIPGQKTRQAMHMRLLGLQPLVFVVAVTTSAAKSDMAGAAEIAAARALIAQADEKLAALAAGLGARDQNNSNSSSSP